MSVECLLIYSGLVMTHYPSPHQSSWTLNVMNYNPVIIYL